MKNSISQNEAQVKTVTLSDGSTREVPQGCQDIALFRRIQEARLNPKPRRATARSDNGRRKSSKRTLATTVTFAPIGLAMATQLDRINARPALPTARRRQLTQLKRHDSRSAATAEAALRAGNLAYAEKTIIGGMLRLLTKLAGTMAPKPSMIDTFVSETAGGGVDPDLTDGPRNLAESIMELNGQDYRAARKAGGTQIRKATAEEAQRGLDIALSKGAGSGLAGHRWSIGMGYK